jgi:hypothetical protein
MSCEQNIRVGDVGTNMEIEVLRNCAEILPLQTASVKQIKVQRPDETFFVKDAVFLTDGSEGVIYFTTAAGDITVEGTYYIQAYLELPTWQGHSDIGEFEVDDNLG